MLLRASHYDSRVRRAPLPDDGQPPFLPGTDAIGSGYDVFGEYATAKSQTEQLFDWRQAPSKTVIFDPKYRIPDPVESNSLAQSTYRRVAGQSIEEFQSNLSIHTNLEGKYGFFSGSLTANYDSRQLTTARNEFSYIQEDVAKWNLILTVQQAMPYLKDQVKDDLANMAPDELFYKYGTHFLRAIIVGGKAVIATSTDQVSFKSSFSLETIAEASYQSLTKQISVKNRTKYDQDISRFQASSEWTVYTYGGAAELGGGLILDDDGYKEWKKSVAETPVFVDFDSPKAFEPIWSLVSDPARKADLENAYKDFAARTTERGRIYPASVTGIVVIAGNDSQIDPPPGYTKIPYDLNRNSGGEYIYICFQDTAGKDIMANNTQAVVDLAVISGDHKDIQPPPGFVKLQPDLNKESGGKFIYLCYKQGAAGDLSHSIKSIMVIGAGYLGTQPPEGFVKIDMDLNAGSGGDYIYACYSRTV